MATGPEGWRLEEKAGEGATAVVHRGRRGAVVAAVKIAKTGAPPEALAVETVLLRALARRWGPRLIEAGPDFLVTTWTEGRPLEIVDTTAFTAKDRDVLAAVVAHGVGRGIDELHAMGVRHGDVKRGNVIVSAAVPTVDRAEDRGASLIDMGLAVRGEGFAGGTPRYLAPEIRSGGAATPAADLFALGVVLAEIIEPSVATAADPVAAWRERARPHDEIVSWIGILLGAAAGARPSAAWVADRAARFLGLARDEAEEIEARRARVRRSYLALRRRELGEGGVPAFDGPTRAWLEESMVNGGEEPIAPLDALGRTRWLTALVGPAAASWSSEESESALATRLLDLCAKTPPEAWIEEDARIAAPTLPAGDSTERWIAMTRALARPAPSPALLACAEDDIAAGRAPAAVAFDLAHAFLRRGEIGRASAAATHAPAAPETKVLRADLARRLGEPEEADRLARSIAEEPSVKSGAHAILARLAWDRGDLASARTLLGVDRSAAAAEVRGLIAYSENEPERGLREMERANAADARLANTRGMLEHLRGDAVAAIASFQSAVEMAAREGAIVEEATYLTGLAAAAVDAGDIARALSSSTRGAVLWERLGSPARAARAFLSRAAAYALVGASHEADAAADLARTEAIASNDPRAAAFARWAKVETRLPGDPIARAEALAADAELEACDSGNDDDRIRSVARLLVYGGVSVVTPRIEAIDQRVARASSQVRWEWWGARAHASSSQRVLAEIVALLDVPASIASKGPALANGARLAAELGDGDAARRLETARRQEADRLRAGTPSALAEALASVRWARTTATPTTTPNFGSLQLEQLESIVRALATRDRLKPLLEQVLDTMILWTGVERGLLLLRAPEGNLVPRVARNLAKKDLRGEQLSLSMSLARRAIEERQPIVATDAFAQHGDLHASIHALELRSVLAVPLVARGDVLGVVYLDDRVRRGAFGPSELAWVRLVSSQAALAIADARDQALLRRAVRRAERANARLTQDLDAREAELARARVELAGTRFSYDRIIGRSEPMRDMLRLVDRVTATDVPVLVTGESGTGKELVARAIHENGARKARPFVSENCGSVPESLLESTLFGHVRGAFTGASTHRAGLFDVADGGTLFLDEIGEMSLAMQTKLLRVLQNGEVRAVGSEKTHHVNVRILAATHRDLAAMVKAGTFREDLFYRLDVVTVRVPPLRERAMDIPPLVARFVSTYGGESAPKVTRAAMERLVAYPWPGNVRQLENEVRRALVLAEDRIDTADLSDDVAHGGRAAAREAGLGLKGQVDALESQLVKEALERTKGNQTKAAEALGISRFGLQKMMRRLGMRD